MNFGLIYKDGGARSSIFILSRRRVGQGLSFFALYAPLPFGLESAFMSNMPSDTEAATTSVPLEPAQRVLAGKRSLWESIRSNPKVIFIAFFASYVLPPLDI